MTPSRYRAVLTLMPLVVAACGSDDSPEPGASRSGDAAGVEAPYPVPEWTTADATAHGMDPSALDELAALAEPADSHCLLVTRHGRVVAEHYWDGWDASTEQVVYSATKSFASALVGIARDRGELGVEDAASEYIEEWRGSESESVQISHLLANNSGREWDFITDYVSMAVSASDKTQFAIDLGQQHPPGTHWEYNNSAIQALDRVLEVATGESPADYAQQHLFAPLGMKSSMGTDAAGNTLMFSDLSASCRDLARFGYLFLRKGVWAEGERVISEEWVEESTTAASELSAAYGYLWWLNREGHYVMPSAPNRVEAEGPRFPELSREAYAAVGMQGQLIAVDPAHDIVMTRIGGDPDPVAAVSGGQLAAGDELVAVLLDALGRAIVE